MFTINIKGKENPKSLEQVKLELVFFKTGYPRVSKVINIAGPITDWDAKRQQFNSKGIEATERNKRLLELKAKYLKVAEEWEAEDADWSPVQWSHCFDVEVEKKASFKVKSVLTVLREVVQINKEKERIKNGKVITSLGNAKTYHYLEMRLSEFVADKYNRQLSSYYFTDITEDFVYDFAIYLQKKGIERGNNGGVPERLRKLYGLCYNASKMSVPGVDLSIFEQSRHLMKRKETAPKSIPTKVMMQIEALDRTLLTRVEKIHLDLFLFSFYAGGIASVDACYLTWDCVDKDGYLCYERIKFPKKARIKLNAKALGILDKYKDKCFQNYMLPIFSVKHKTEVQRNRRIQKVRDNVNAVLKKVQKIIKYKETITWYSARGTFISTMIAADINPIDVAAMAGNSPLTIYKYYYKNVDQSQTDRTVAKALGC
ncbi:MAG: phage integrase SAM-like domain-containing protein [Rikenellaceae bacterium]